MGPVGEDSAAQPQGAHDPDAGWKGGRAKVRSGFYLFFFTESLKTTSVLRPSFVSPRHTDGPPNIWDTSGISGNVFAHPQASSSAPYPQELNSTWRKTIEEPIHMSTAEKSGRPERDQDLRCQSGPSAKDSVIFSGGDYSKNYGADQQRLQISDLHFDKSLRQQPLLAGR